LSVVTAPPPLARQNARARMVTEQTGVHMQARRYREELKSAVQAIAALKSC